MTLLLYLKIFYKTEHGFGSSPIWSSRCVVSSRLTELVLEMNSTQLANSRKGYLVNHVKVTSCCLQGLSPFLLSNSLTTCHLEMQCSTPTHIDELPEGTTTVMLMQKE